jgi:hypothetical protein
MRRKLQLTLLDRMALFLKASMAQAEMSSTLLLPIGLYYNSSCIKNRTIGFNADGSDGRLTAI